MTKIKEKKYVVTSSEFVATQSSVSVMQDNKTMLRQRKSLSRQQTHAVVRNFVATKEIIIATEIEKNHKSMSQHSKECCNKVEELEAENYVATEKKMRE